MFSKDSRTRYDISWELAILMDMQSSDSLSISNIEIYEEIYEEIKLNKHFQLEFICRKVLLYCCIVRFFVLMDVETKWLNYFLLGSFRFWVQKCYKDLFKAWFSLDVILWSETWNHFFLHVLFSFLTPH